METLVVSFFWSKEWQAWATDPGPWLAISPVSGEGRATRRGAGGADHGQRTVIQLKARVIPRVCIRVRGTMLGRMVR